MLFKRGSTISAAEGGCQAEVGGAFEMISYLVLFDCLQRVTQLLVRWPVLGLPLVWEVSAIYSPPATSTLFNAGN